MSEAYDALLTLRHSISNHVIGQEKLIDRLLIALLSDGHLLVEGAPGLAKTKIIKHLADAIEGDFHRIQFTPDLLPSDVTGTDVFHPDDSSFSFQQGPIFHNLLLADEINRAPAKVQSALLEAMAERQVTIGMKTYPLPRLFLVMATQNAIEQEGTYPLPEAQLDRFQLYVRIEHPDAEAELGILRLAREEYKVETHAENCLSTKAPEVSQAQLFKARQEVADIHLSANIEEYIVQLVMATRKPHNYSAKLAEWIQGGVSPRASIALERCSKARAWLAGRDYVTPDDIQELCPDVLSHRLLLSFTAQAEGVSHVDVVEKLLDMVAVP